MRFSSKWTSKRIQTGEDFRFAGGFSVSGTGGYNQCLPDYELQLCDLYAASFDGRLGGWGGIDGLIKMQGPPPPIFQRLHEELTARYPCICTLDDDHVDVDGV